MTDDGIAFKMPDLRAVICLGGAIFDPAFKAFSPPRGFPW